MRFNFDGITKAECDYHLLVRHSEVFGTKGIQSHSKDNLHDDLLEVIIIRKITFLIYLKMSLDVFMSLDEFDVME